MDQPTNYSPDEIRGMVEQGLMTEEEGADAVVLKKKADSFYDMTPDELEYGLDRGLVTPTEIESWDERKNSPIKFYAKDITGSIGEGLFKATVSTAKTLGLASDYLSPIGLAETFAGRGSTPEKIDDFLEQAEGFFQEVMPDANEYLNNFFSAKTTAGEVVSTLTQFAAPFAGVSRGGKVLQIGERAVSKLVSKGFATAHPQATQFIASMFEEAVLGAATDFTAFDPFETGNLSNFIQEYPSLQNPVTEFLAIQEDDPEAVARMKQAVEGIFPGVAGDLVMKALGKLKHLLVRQGGDATLDAAEKLAFKFEEMPQKKRVVPTQKSSITKTDKADQTIFSMDMIERLSNQNYSWVDYAEHGDFTYRFKELGDGQKVIDQIMSHFTEDIDHVTAKGKGNAAFDKEAKQLLSTLEGSIGNKINYTKSVFAQIKNLPKAIRVVKNLFESYTYYIDGLVKELQKGGTNLSKVEFLTHLKQFQEMQVAVMGVRAYSGKVLGAWKGWGGEGLNRFKALEQIPDAEMEKIVQSGDVDHIIKLWDRAKNNSTKAQIARAMGKNKYLQGTLEWIQASLLSDPATQFVNIIGTSTGMVFDEIATTLALAERAVTHPSKAKAVLGELRVRHAGYRKAFSECFRFDGLNKKLFKFGTEGTEARKIFYKNPQGGTFYKALFSGQPQLDYMMKVSEQAGGSVTDWKLLGLPVGKLFTYPFHGLTAGDEVFKNFGYQAELSSLLYRQGAGKGLEGKALREWIGHMQRDMAPEMHYEALAKARELTYTNELGEFSKGLNKILNNNRLGLSIRILEVPFFKVVVNLAKFGANRTPLGLLSKGFRENWDAGGIKAYEAANRVLLGTGMLAYAHSLYEDGLITGYIPPEQIDLANANGILPYAFKAGNKWIDYNRNDPVAFFLGTAANLSHVAEMYEDSETDVDEVMFALLTAFTDPIMNKAMVKSFKELTDILSSTSSKKFAKFGASQVKKLLPWTTLWDHTQKEWFDEYQREVQGMMDVLQGKIASGELARRRHPVYGYPLVNEPRALGIYNTKTQSADPVLNEMWAVGAYVRKMDQKIVRDGVTIELSAHDMDQVNDILQGLPLRDTLQQVINSSNYQSIKNADERGKILKEIVSEFRSSAKDMFLMNRPDMQEEFELKINERVESIVGERVSTGPARFIHYQLNRRKME